MIIFYYKLLFVLVFCVNYCKCFIEWLLFYLVKLRVNKNYRVEVCGFWMIKN